MDLDDFLDESLSFERSPVSARGRKSYVPLSMSILTADVNHPEIGQEEKGD
jgi:hypothetical protein